MLLVHVGPDLVRLDQPAGKPFHFLVHQLLRLPSGERAQPHDRVSVNASDSFGASDGVTLDQELDARYCLLKVQTHIVQPSFSLVLVLGHYPKNGILGLETVGWYRK